MQQIVYSLCNFFLLDILRRIIIKLQRFGSFFYLKNGTYVLSSSPILYLKTEAESRFRNVAILQYQTTDEVQTNSLTHYNGPSSEHSKSSLLFI
jgi:hypothetical protein